MTTSRTIDDDTLAELAELAARWTGFSNEAVHRASIRERLRTWLADGGDLDRLRRNARDGESTAVQLLAEAVSVGETYFFRQGDHFEWLARSWRIDEVLAARGRVRAWSAGCASGEEAWSIASFLRAHAGTKADLHVLGTDLVTRQVAAARDGIYRRWSARSDPKYPVVHHGQHGELIVMKHLRPLVTFASHNLLDPLPESFGRFDLVLCRNVLVYLRPEAARRACEHIARVLSPEGLVVFAPADLRAAPPGLSPVGPPELCMFGPPRTDDGSSAKSAAGRSRSQPASSSPASVAKATNVRSITSGRKSASALRAVARPAASARAPSPAEPPPLDPASTPTPRGSPAVALHIAAIGCIDRGDRRRAAHLLAELEATAPGYLPGLLECALFHQQAGDRQKAERLMRTLLQRASSLPPDMRIPGPEDMPVVFYSTSARAFFEGRR